MPLASAPTTPERPTQAPGFRRAFTAPIKSSKTPSQRKDKQDDNADTLFAHDAATIISFTASQPADRRDSLASKVQDGSIMQYSGTLPWASLTERTVAAGPLRIYHVLDIAFLHSGSILQPLLPKSQCWCVDGVSKFVLRIRDNSYYRIELPSKTENDQRQVSLLRDTLSKVLQYEKTPCPFKRGFTVELPEPPETPVKMVPWRPKVQRASDSSPLIVSSTGHIKRKDGDFLHSRLASDAGQADTGKEHTSPSPPIKVADFPLASSDANSGSTTDEEDVGGCLDAPRDPGGSPNQNHSKTQPIQVPKRPARANAGRTITAPASLIPQHNHPTPKMPSNSPSRPGSSSLSSSEESFHSAVSPSPLRSPSPSPGDIPTPQKDLQKAEFDPTDTSQVTPTSPLWDLTDSNSVSSSRSCTSLRGPSAHALRVRQTFQKRRTQSPLPPSANLSAPHPQHPRSLSRIPSDMLLRATCSSILRPPLQLVALMVRIAVRIAQGALSGSTFGFIGRGEKIPCSWDFSSDGSDTSDDSWYEDDYGVNLSRTVSARQSAATGESWEID